MPRNSPECHDKGYLVPGDQVIVSAQRPDLVCADYINAKGLSRAGWLPRASVTLQVEEAPTVEDWIGRWTGGPEQAITIQKGRRPDELQIRGEATYGALDPDRVGRGTVNMGEIGATVKPQGASLAFATVDDATRPYDGGDAHDCRVRMRRLGPFLLVEDNGSCGGMNVSFSGAYRRAEQAAPSPIGRSRPQAARNRDRS